MIIIVEQGTFSFADQVCHKKISKTVYLLITQLNNQVLDAHTTDALMIFQTIQLLKNGASLLVNTNATMSTSKFTVPTHVLVSKAIFLYVIYLKLQNYVRTIV